MAQRKVNEAGRYRFWETTSEGSPVSPVLNLFKILIEKMRKIR